MKTRLKADKHTAKTEKVTNNSRISWRLRGLLIPSGHWRTLLLTLVLMTPEYYMHMYVYVHQHADTHTQHI